jgi:AGCS family alanine or glycine:cation symporter
VLATLNDLLWGKVLVSVLILVGLTLTVASRFVQVRYFLRMFRILGQAFHHERGHLSSFQALALSVAGRVGAGNIAGVAVAITLGGPGAIFWMWVVGLLGMATSFFECSLAQLFKRAEPDGTYRGGPAYYIERGLRLRWLAGIYSVLLLVTFGLAFIALQSFTASSSLADSFGVPVHATGAALTALLGLIIFGGIRRIAAVTEYLVPIMAIGYLLVALAVLALNIAELPGALALIVKSAFGLEEAAGGAIGAALMQGVKRGLFSNEAGLGSAPNVAAVAWVRHPGSQGIVQAFSVFIDTLIMCTCTASIIILSSLYEPGMLQVDGVVLTQAALADHVGDWGRSFVSVALMLFAFSSILYNYYLGENALNFFSEENRTLFNGFRCAVLVLVFWGSIQDLGTVFAFADLAMGLLAICNLAALALLLKIGMRILRDFDDQVGRGIDEPVMHARRFEDLDIDRRAWEQD